MVELIHGDGLEVLAGMPDNHVQAVICDPPYSERTHKGHSAVAVAPQALQPSAWGVTSSGLSVTLTRLRWRRSALRQRRVSRSCALTAPNHERKR